MRPAVRQLLMMAAKKKMTYCLYLDGVDDYINLGQPEVLDLKPDEEFTVTIMSKWLSAHTGYRFSKGGGSSRSGHQYSAYVSSSGVSGAVGGTSRSLLDITPADTFFRSGVRNVLVGVAHECGMIYNDMYGSLAETGEHTTEVDVLIGARRGTTDNTGTGVHFKGYVADFVVKDGNGNIISWIPIDEGQGNTVTCKITGITGTIVGGTWVKRAKDYSWVEEV